MTNNKLHTVLAALILVATLHAFGLNLVASVVIGAAIFAAVSIFKK